MTEDPTYDRLGILRPPDARLADAEPEHAVLRRLPTWPDSPDLRGHDELHPVPGAVEANRGRACRSCGTLLWDRHRVPSEHTVEVCAWNRAWTDRRDAKSGRSPKTGADAPNIMELGF